jgi:hypothetical protein
LKASIVRVRREEDFDGLFGIVQKAIHPNFLSFVQVGRLEHSAGANKRVCSRSIYVIPSLETSVHVCIFIGKVVKFSLFGIGCLLLMRELVDGFSDESDKEAELCSTVRILKKDNGA